MSHNPKAAGLNPGCQKNIGHETIAKGTTQDHLLWKTLQTRATKNNKQTKHILFKKRTKKNIKVFLK